MMTTAATPTYDISDDAMDVMEMAWVIIANAGGGDWAREAEAWREAAGRWRDDYHKVLLAHLESGGKAA